MSLKQVLIATDQWFNAAMGGMADEAISARAYRRSTVSPRWMIARQCIDALFFWQIDHCYQSYIAEIERKQLPREYRT